MQKSRILFVEDDFVLNMDSCEFLRESGFVVTEAYCAQAAFEAISKAGRLAGLVTDIDLGGGDDGFEVARRARAVYAHIPVVYISGTAAARHAAEGVEGSEFICKPFHPRQILEALGRATHLEAA